MVSGGLAIVFVTDMDRAVRFYSETLGIPLKERYGNEWAAVAADGLSIGIHPRCERAPAPGVNGAIQIGFHPKGKLEAVVEALAAKGVRFTGPIVEDPPVRIAYFTDPDGNLLHFVELSGATPPAEAEDGAWEGWTEP